LKVFLQPDCKADFFNTFYDESVQKYVSPQLRKDLLKFVLPELFIAIEAPLTAEKLFFVYFVILEANNNPYTI